MDSSKNNSTNNSNEASNDGALNQVNNEQRPLVRYRPIQRDGHQADLPIVPVGYEEERGEEDLTNFTVIWLFTLFGMLYVLWIVWHASDERLDRLFRDRMYRRF